MPTVARRTMRPEIAPVISLNNLGEATKVENLKALYSAVDYIKQTCDHGLLLPDTPLNAATTLISYADASWANAEKLKSQFGALVFATTPQVTQLLTLGSLLDWKSGKTSRVCCSTLAAEAMAADEAVDRTAYVNLFLTEVFTGQAAHKAQPFFRQLHVTDAKSLYDVVCSENPTLTDKRSLVNVRAVQECISPQEMHWIPTDLMRADALTKLSSQLREELHEWLKWPLLVLRRQNPKESFTSEKVAL